MAFVLGFFIAVAVGLTGVGAGTITAPVLMLSFGLKPAVAVGTALLFSSAIKIVVAPVYLRRRQVDFKVLMLLCGGGVPGVLIGVGMLARLSSRSHEGAIVFVLGLTVIAASLATLYRTLRTRTAARTPRDRSGWLPPLAAVIGGEVGFSSAGAGALGSVALLNLTNLTPAQVVGTDMVFGLVLSVCGGSLHFSADHFDSNVLWKLIVGGVVGVISGAMLSGIIPPRPLKVGLTVWLASLGTQLCWRALS
jgi:uncharacterized membrane protein YfcA